MKHYGLGICCEGGYNGHLFLFANQTTTSISYIVYQLLVLLTNIILDQRPAKLQGSHINFSLIFAIKIFQKSRNFFYKQ